MASYVNLDTIQRPSGGAALNTQWGDQVNDNFTYLDAREQFVVHLAVAVSIPNGAATVLNYDTVDKDTVSGWSAVNHNYTVSSSAAGLWVFNCIMSWASNATGVRASSLNGSGFNFMSAAQDDNQGRQTTTWIILAAANTTWSMQAYQTSGAGLNTGTGANVVQFSGCRIG